MTIHEIENYLSKKNTHLDESIYKSIEELRQNGISQKNEEQANYCWCLKEIYKIQKGFISVVDYLKNKKYENAWNTLDYIDISLSYLENNFDITQESDRYHLMFIARMIKEYQKLFPYHHFLSRECVIKAEKCSICGKPISLRHSCGHKVGKIYMGELCLRDIVDMEFKAFSLVTDPFDKFAYVQLQDKEYDYGMLEVLMAEIDSPYDEFYVEMVKVIKPEYRGIGRNQLCPCGSGKKYKKCHLGTKGELMNHYKIHFLKSTLHNKNGFVGTFGTWKE